MSIFTQQERFAILFLIFLLVLGSSVYLYKLNHPSSAPAYIIKDFEKRIEEEKSEEGAINYNIPLPQQEISAAFPKKKNRSDIKVNVNTADFNELQQIPGIGPVYSKRIIEYRKKNNGFKTKEEIKKIKGIGNKKFGGIKNLITVK